MTEQNLQFVTTAITIDGIITHPTQPTQKTHPTQPTQQTHPTQPTQQTHPTQPQEYFQKNKMRNSNFHRNIFVVFENGESFKFGSKIDCFRKIMQTNAVYAIIEIHENNPRRFVKLTKAAFNIFCEDFKHPKISKLTMFLMDGEEVTV